MCGKSMLGSLYLSILLISCLSFDFGSANSSKEEIEGECVRNSDCSSDACDTKTNRCYVYHSKYVCDIPTHFGYYDTLDDAIDARNGNDQCGCVDYNRANNYQINVGTGIKSSSNVDAWV